MTKEIAAIHERLEEEFGARRSALWGEYLQMMERAWEMYQSQWAIYLEAYGVRKNELLADIGYEWGEDTLYGTHTIRPMGENAPLRRI